MMIVNCWTNNNHAKTKYKSFNARNEVIDLIKYIYGLDMELGNQIKTTIMFDMTGWQHSKLSSSLLENNVPNSPWMKEEISLSYNIQ